MRACERERVGVSERGWVCAAKFALRERAPGGSRLVRAAAGCALWLPAAVRVCLAAGLPCCGSAAL